MIAISILLFILLTITCLGIGTGVSATIKLRYQSWLEYFAISTGLGLISLMIIGFILGTLGWLNRWIVIPILGILLINGIISLRRRHKFFNDLECKCSLESTRFIDYTVIGFIVIFALRNVIYAFIFAYHLELFSSYLFFIKWMCIPLLYVEL